MSNPLLWTCKTPTRPGFYFYRVDPDGETEVVTVYHDEEMNELMYHYLHEAEDGGNWFANAGDACEWSGPIKEPV